MKPIFEKSSGTHEHDSRLSSGQSVKQFLSKHTGNTPIRFIVLQSQINETKSFAEVFAYFSVLIAALYGIIPPEMTTLP